MTSAPAEDKNLDSASVLGAGWRPLWELLGAKTARPRFGTFLRPFSAGAPREFPVDFPRLPLSMYSEKGLVYLASAPRKVPEKIKDLVTRCARCDTSALKESGSKAVVLRGELCKYIHKEGGLEWIRPLNGRERDKALGFPPDASALAGEEQESPTSFSWGRLEASGNAFSPAIVAALLKPLCSAILQGGVPPLRPGFPNQTSAESALKALGASSSAPLLWETPAAEPRHRAQRIFRCLCLL